MISLGAVTVTCPGCGGRVQVEIHGSGPDWTNTIRVAPGDIEHTCPPPLMREPMSIAA